VAEHGLDVGVDEIARRAGVGIGTLYRRFPTKHALVSALVLDALGELIGAARALLAEAEPADGFERFLRHMIGVRAATGVSMTLLWSADTDETARAELTPLVTRLLENAQRAGTIRAELSHEDVPMLVWSVGAVIDATACARDPSGCASRR
jgi:AcrR family transcriptional regulator